MGIPVLILGESGSGKSASLRNFQPGEIGIFNVSSKPLPFRSPLKTFNTDNYPLIEAGIKKAHKENGICTFAVDDAQYLMANEFMRTAKITGFQKFTDIALNFWTLVRLVVQELPPEVIVYFLSHIERDAEGHEKCKTIGKLLDEKITVEGLFTIVLKTLVKDGGYFFTTQNSGMDTVKSPIGMFQEAVIENDLKAVDDTIREYYGITGGTK